MESTYQIIFTYFQVLQLFRVQIIFSKFNAVSTEEIFFGTNESGENGLKFVIFFSIFWYHVPKFPEWYLFPSKLIELPALLHPLAGNIASH